MMSRIGSKSALTLIEVMITVIILTVGIFGIIRAYMKSLDVLYISKGAMVEVSLAERKMAELRRSELENGGLEQAREKGAFPSPYEYFDWESEVYPSDVKGLNLLKVKCFDGRGHRLNEFVLVSYAKSK